MTINAYFCTAGEQEVLAECIDGWSRYETSFVNEIVFESTRGKAKSRFHWRYASGCRYEFEFTDVRCKLLAHDYATQPGFAHSSDPLWERVSCG